MTTPKARKTSYPSWVKDYVKKLQGEMKLAHWQIEFENHYCDDSAFAEISVLPAQHSATIALCKTWRKWSPSVMRSTIAHELMHCHLNAINEIAEEHLEELSPKTFPMRKKGIDYVNERVTDALAEMIAPHLSMPRMPVRRTSSTLSHTLAYSRTRSGKRPSAKNGKTVKKAGKKTVRKRPVRPKKRS
jgi:hypothetical protein